MSRLLAAVVALAIAFVSSGMRADDLTLKTARPVVVKTTPESGTDEVNPNLAEIKVTFSKPMQDESWSWSSDLDETYPKATDKPKYLADKRTCVLPVKLEPGKVYALWLNSEKFHGFQDPDGNAAVPCLLVLKTKK